MDCFSLRWAFGDTGVMDVSGALRAGLFVLSYTL
jgi:hypothetical protein